MRSAPRRRHGLPRPPRPPRPPRRPEPRDSSHISPAPRRPGPNSERLAGPPEHRCGIDARLSPPSGTSMRQRCSPANSVAASMSPLQCPGEHRCSNDGHVRLDARPETRAIARRRLPRGPSGRLSWSRLRTRDLVVSKAGRASPAVRRRAPVSCPLARWGALVQARATLRPGTRHEPYDLRKRLRWRLVVAPLPTGRPWRATAIPVDPP